MFLANKYHALGIFFDNKNLLICNKLTLTSINKKFLTTGKVHSLNEANKFGKLLNMVFISNVFETKSYPEKKNSHYLIFFQFVFYLKKRKFLL